MQFYCEHHENIRILHVSVTLPSRPDNLTSLAIYDRKTLRLRHAFQSCSIALPASLTVAELPVPHVVDLTWTYRISADSLVSSSSNDIPLSDPFLLSSLACTACNLPIFKAEASDVSWRLMPSENWAEMMDSWHCHRGVSDHHHHEIHNQYTLPDHIVSAAERIHARPGIGLIGPSYLLTHRADLAPSIQVSDDTVTCSCGQTLGQADTIECKLEKSATWDGHEKVDPLLYVTVNMMTLLESSAVHKFLCYADEKSESWIVWILASDARVTASGLCNASPGMRVMKVMFRAASQTDHQEQDIEHMQLGQAEFDSLVATMHSHHKIMGGTGMDEWIPSFLPRYERTHVTHAQVKNMS